MANEIDWSQYSETKVGAVEQTTIAEINSGKQKDFRSDKYWEASENSKSQIAEQKESPAIQIVTANKAELIINLPQNGAVHPKSTLAQFKKTYGGFPEPGMSVNTQTDQNGFHRVILQK